MGQLSLTKIFVFVDDDVNVHSMDDGLWSVTTSDDAVRNSTIIDINPSESLYTSSSLINLGSKLGIDATQKTKEEGYEREIQELVKVDDTTKSLVDSKWSSYGL